MSDDKLLHFVLMSMNALLTMAMTMAMTME